MKNKRSKRKRFSIIIGFLILITSIPMTSAVSSSINNQSLDPVDAITMINVIKQKLQFRWPFPFITIIYKIIEFIESIPFQSP